MTVHYRIVIKGIVQGVGFRPWVYQQAHIFHIKGNVLNSGEGVFIEAEGEDENIRQFMAELKNHPPKLARIDHFIHSQLPTAGYPAFEILSSHSGTEKEALIPPDVAACGDCRKELFDLKDRHYHYPFTNCTNCGPRFTIIKEVPYDRPQTSMAVFEMCADCAAEYHDPANRRFHAQPVACPQCGPSVEIMTSDGKRIAGQRDWLETTWRLIGDGQILAIKGIGGFHLACDAKNHDAVKILRSRKGREAKPFAVMCRDLDSVRQICLLSNDESEWISSAEAPIVVLKKKGDSPLSDAIAPNLNTVGVMLPYSPLHVLLLSGKFDALVMTSGNYSGLPLVKDNSTALAQLSGIADYFLVHNREIINRCDDSVIQLIDGQAHFFRRSRGYIPRPVPVLVDEKGPIILAIGGEMKNSFCILKKNQAFMSQYIGEMDTVEGEQNLFESAVNFERLLGVKSDIVAFDSHPYYVSARIAHQIPAARYHEVQHHHAHLAAVMAENRLPDQDMVGIILDGTGYGTDGCLWGFEIIKGNYTSFDRLYHLAYVPLPGGEMAIRQPWRTAISYLFAFPDKNDRESALLFFDNKEVNLVEQILKSKLNTPLACGCGRLFDAVSALLGICRENTYEGQAAIELGELVDDTDENFSMPGYAFEIEDGIIVPREILKGVIADRINNIAAEVIAAKFHNTIIAIICELAQRIRAQTGIEKIAFSGGTWQNHYLCKYAKKALSSLGFEVYYHRQVPANDGGIALGQAMVTYYQLLLEKR